MKSERSATAELISFFRECYSLMKVKGIREFEFEKGEIRISIKRSARHGASAAADEALSAAPVLTPRTQAPRKLKTLPEPAEKKVLNTIKSPLAGVFYNAASPNSKPYIKPPCNVSGGETLCIIEAMKVMNEIESPSSCRVIRMIAKNAELVKKDEDLFEIE